MFKCFVFVLFLDMVSAHKILVVFPVPSTSHAILGAGYVRSLLEAGHEVTYLTSVLYDKPHPKLQQVDVSHNFDVIAFNDVLSVEKMMTKELDMQDLFTFSDLMFDLVNATLRNPNVVKLLEDPNEKYDVVVTEWLYTEVYSGFALVFDCPLIWSSSMDAHSMVLWLMDEAPNPAYTADHLSHENEPFQFWTRVSQLWIYLSRIYLKWWTESKQSTIYENAFRPFAERKGIAFVPLSKMKYTGALMLGNSHASFTQSLKLPENYKSILGYHIPKEIKALPEDVQKIMDDAKHGVIYFSMGSMMKSASFPATLKRDLIKMFAGLRETVLWKFEEEFTDLPKNVHVFKWLPQLSVLGHPNCKLFITHAGILSISEAIHVGVPIISVPMYGDQFLNAHRAVQKGFSRRILLEMNFVQQLQEAIEDMTSDPSYRKNMKEVAVAFHHRPVSPSAELVHWVEHVIVTRGAPHLRSKALRMPFYQKYYLDLAVLVILCISMLGFALKLLRNMRGKVDVKKKTK